MLMVVKIVASSSSIAAFIGEAIPRQGSLTSFDIDCRPECCSRVIGL
jgi:hypothetical protein